MIDTIEPTVETTEAVARQKRDSAVPGSQFTIDCDEHAEWLLRKLANIEAEKARVQAQAAAMLSQLEADAQSLNRFFSGQLQEYCRIKLATAGGRRKSILFFNATAGFRTVPAGLRISDQSAAIRFAQIALPTAVKTVQTLDGTAYRDAATTRLHETGEILPGMQTTPERESFSIRFSKVEKD